jgi:hypothetical protein
MRPRMKKRDSSTDSFQVDNQIDSLLSTDAQNILNETSYIDTFTCCNNQQLYHAVAVWLNTTADVGDGSNMIERSSSLPSTINESFEMRQRRNSTASTVFDRMTSSFTSDRLLSRQQFLSGNIQRRWSMSTFERSYHDNCQVNDRSSLTKPYDGDADKCFDVLSVPDIDDSETNRNVTSLSTIDPTLITRDRCLSETWPRQSLAVLRYTTSSNDDDQRSSSSHKQCRRQRRVRMPTIMTNRTRRSFLRHSKFPRMPVPMHNVTTRASSSVLMGRQRYFTILSMPDGVDHADRDPLTYSTSNIIEHDLSTESTRWRTQSKHSSAMTSAERLSISSSNDDITSNSSSVEHQRWPREQQNTLTDKRHLALKEIMWLLTKPRMPLVFNRTKKPDTSVRTARKFDRQKSLSNMFPQVRSCA